MASRSFAGTTTWPFGEVLTIGMGILPLFNYIIVCTTNLYKLNNGPYQHNDEAPDVIRERSARPIHEHDQAPRRSHGTTSRGDRASRAVRVGWLAPV
jgi:hypothetical protein